MKSRITGAKNAGAAFEASAVGALIIGCVFMAGMMYVFYLIGTTYP